MLKTLTVGNFALIEQAGIEFAAGLNILTGETGAGKSILVDALNTVLGGRASTDYIRGGSDFFRVEAVFEAAGNPQLAAILDDQGIELEDGLLIVSRLLSRQGKSTVLVNGCHVTLGVLRQIGGLLVDMHGQHENQALLKPGSHLALLDAFDPDIKDKWERYHAFFRAWTDVAGEIGRITGDSRERAQRLDMLQWQTDEIAAAALRAGEEEELEQEIRILANAEKIITAVGRAYALLNADGQGASSVLSALAETRKELETVCRYDLAVEGRLAAVADALYQLEDVAAELRDYCETVDFNPRRLAELQERLDIIHKLKKKYGASIAEVIAYHHGAVKELTAITNYEQQLAELQALQTELDSRLAAAAAELTEARTRAAGVMAGQIREQLAQLGMPKAKLVFAVKTGERYTATGADEVVILFSANPGEEPKPLQKIASGGELSRIALAIKAVGASRDSAGTMVFDEVDSGVGGQTAQMVAEKIALVSRNKQVLCITHLPQIAAMADYHIYVEKDIDGERTRTAIKILAADTHCREVTRMICGDNITAAALNNTAEMIATAQEKKRKMET